MFLEKLSLLLSVNKRIPIKDLEITAVRICPVRCEYCPQTALINASKNGTNSKSINLDRLRNYVNHIPKNTTLHWTGYSESLANKDFPEMVEYAKDQGFSQSISTTLSGHKRSVEYFSRSMAFKQITLHMPDEKGLMNKGSLKINEDYITSLRNFFLIHLKKEKYACIYCLLWRKN